MAALSPLLITAFKSKIFGVDRATGELRWKVKLGSTFAMTDVVELAVDDELVIACTRKHLAFIEYQTGKTLKIIDRDDLATGSHRPTIVVDGKQVFIAGSGQLACYSADGELQWEQKFPSEGYGDIAIGFPHNVRQADTVGQS